MNSFIYGEVHEQIAPTCSRIEIAAINFSLTRAVSSLYGNGDVSRVVQPTPYMLFEVVVGGGVLLWPKFSHGCTRITIYCIRLGGNASCLLVFYNVTYQFYAIPSLTIRAYPRTSLDLPAP